MEVKFHDVDVDDAVIESGGTIQNAGSVNLIAQGNTDSTRIGRKCAVVGIEWRFQVAILAQADVNQGTDVVRVLIYLDHQANAATAAVLDILEVDNYQSPFNLANDSRFDILFERVYDVNATAAAGQNAEETTSAYGMSDELELDELDISLDFSGALGALTEITSNNIGVLLLCKNGRCNFESKLRLLFVG